MASFNSITLIGYLGRAPELRYTPQGTPVTDFSVATTEKRKNRDGEWEDHTEWFKVTCWGKTAENASEYLKKGSQVYVVGRLATRSWTDDDGMKRFTLEVTCTDLKFLGKKDDDGPQEERSSKKAKQKEEPGEVADDDVPF